jgi:hypothetical protein
MSTESALFRSRAEQCRADAALTALPNVRESLLRAEAAWIAMAERGERSDALRATREARTDGA